MTHSMSKILGSRRMWAVASVAGCLFAASAAMAGEPPQSADVPHVAVKYNDLNLNTDQGAVALYHRIVAAARLVCPTADGHDLKGFVASRSCQAAAVARAVQAVPSPQLAAVYEAHGPRG